ncbi:MAG: hypothetical protein D6791_08695, partial [Chloroflexi bacterium]
MDTTLLRDTLILFVLLVVTMGAFLLYLRRRFGQSIMVTVIFLVAIVVTVSVLDAFVVGEAGLTFVTAAAGAVLGIASMAALIITLQRRVIHPVRELTTVAQKIAAGDVSG